MMNRSRQLTWLAVSILLGSASMEAQTDTTRIELESITIQSTRNRVASQWAPVSIGARALDRFTENSLTLTESLGSIPGIWLNDRDNASLGERISIRGMGWRSAFGVRGVNVLLDGIPLTMPDGQSTLDLIDPSVVRYAEVMKGPSSSHWGNAGGGVLYLSTERTRDNKRLSIESEAGSFGLFRSGVGFGAGSDNAFFSGYASHSQKAGYRDYSAWSRTRLGLRSDIKLSTSTTLLSQLAFLRAPTSEHPGSLNQEDFEATPTMAHARNVDKQAGKAITQSHAGFVLRNVRGLTLIEASAHGGFRNLDNPLSFTYIDLNRMYAGARISAASQISGFDVFVGTDLGLQNDARKNIENIGGFPGRELALDQTERVLNLGALSRAAWTIGPLRIEGGLRLDALKFSADDHLLSNGDQSGSRWMSAWSPSVGLVYLSGNARFFASAGTAFESPTTTELVNRPDLAGGFNAEVGPQRTTSIESGVAWNATSFNIAANVFAGKTSDRLSPFQTEDGGDRTFYRNGGATTQRGLELEVSGSFNDIVLRASTTLAQYRFVDGEQSGNTLPGIPTSRFFALVEYRPGPVIVSTDLAWVDQIYANDANDAFAESYARINLKVTAAAWRLTDSVSLEPYFGMFNLTDTRYAGSVAINAFGGRFFEAAPPRNWRGGLKLSLK